MIEGKHIDLLSISLEGMTEWVKTLQEPAYRGKQIFQWIYQRGAVDIDSMNNLPKILREKIKRFAIFSLPRLLKIQISEDGTRKLLFEMQDGKQVETVLIPQKNSKNLHYSICISSQIGCPVHCAFCATGASGFFRNLSTGEIVGQVLGARHALSSIDNIPFTEKRITNVVYMGMGEPFLNYDSMIKSLRILNEHEGIDIGQRRITVSTSGEVHGIERFIRENTQVTLAVSLHACNDKVRNEIIPMNRKYPLEKLLSALDVYAQKTGRRITFEYILLDGINNARKDAEALAALHEKISCNVNLIPYNEVPGLPFKRPSRKKILEFYHYLKSQNVNVTLRGEHGPGIQAACGQLAVQKG